jgi:hypothetical protein
LLANATENKPRTRRRWLKKRMGATMTSTLSLSVLTFLEYGART